MKQTRKWRRVLAIMLTVVMMLQNVQSVVWAIDIGDDTQKTETEITEEGLEEGEEGEEEPEEDFVDSSEKTESSAVITPNADQSVTVDADGDSSNTPPGSENGTDLTGNTAEISDGISDNSADVSDTTVSKKVSYRGTADDGIKVTVTMTGIDLPEAENVTVSVEKIEGQVPADITDKKDTNPIWLSSSYKVALKKVDNTEISLNDTATVCLELAPNNSVTLPQYKTMEVKAFAGTEGNTAVTDDKCSKDNETIQSVTFASVADKNVFGVVAYRRNSEEIDLGTENQITTSSFQWKANGSAADAWQNIETNTEVPADADIRINVNYEVKKALVKGDVLYFDLPGNFKSSIYNGSITKTDENGKQNVIANYSIGNTTLENGSTVSRVQIVGTDAFYDADTGAACDVKGYISFDGSLQNIESGSGNQDVNFKIGDIEVTFKVPKVPVVTTDSLKVKKTVQDGLGQKNGEIKKFDNMLIYTVTVTAPDTNASTFENVSIADEVTDGEKYIDTFLSDWNGKDSNEKSLITEYQLSGNGIYYQKTAASADGSTSSGDFSVTVEEKNSKTNLPSKFKISSLAPGETVTIKYAIRLKDSIIGLKTGTTDQDKSETKHTITNKVTASVPDTNIKAEAETATVNYHKKWVVKKYEIKDDTHISYTITANSAPRLNLNGWTFEDTLGGGQKYTNITVKWTDESGTTHTEYWKPNDTGSSSGFIVNEGYTTFQWSAKDGNYEYEFKYDVELTDSQNTQSYTNTIKLSGQYNGTNHEFQASTDIGTAYKLDKRKNGSITIDPETGITTIPWKAEIQSLLKDHITIPQGSVYTDTLINTSDYVSQEMTEELLQNISIQAYDSKSQQMVQLPKEFYTVVSVKTGEKITGFTITFGTDTANIENSKYRTKVIITYSSKSSKSIANIEKGNYRNEATFVLSSGEKVWQGWTYKYTFSNLLNKEAVKDSYQCNSETGEKTIKWKLTVNSETAQGMSNINIKDKLPDGLEYAGIEDVSGGNAVESGKVSFASYDKESNEVVFHINDCNEKKIQFYVVTKITEVIYENDVCKYTNQAKLVIGNSDSCVAKAEMKLDFNILEKNIISKVAEDGIISYELKINQAEETLMPDVSDGSLYVIDKMGENLQLLSGSLEMWVDGQKYDKYTIASVDDDPTQFKIMGIPDGKYVRITYNVAARDPDGKITAYNKAELYCQGIKKAEVKREQEITIKSASAGISKGTGIYIIKSDKANYKPLEGAEFEFGTVDVNTDGDFSYHKIRSELKTNSTGYLYFSKDTLGNSLELGKLYYFAETSAPTGYRKDDTKKIFCIIDKPVSDDKKIEGVIYLRNGAGINVFNEEDSIFVTLKGKKIVENSTESNVPTFSFDITANKNAPLQDAKGNNVSTVTYNNDAQGIITFGSIRFKISDLQGADSKEFTYTISERIPDGAKNNKYEGVLYDTKQYNIVIHVFKDTAGKLNYECTVDKETYTEDSISFTNKYDSVNATGKFEPKVFKQVYPSTRTQELEAEKFEFQIQGIKLDNETEFPATTEDLSALKLDETKTIETASNDKTGTVSFSAIEYVLDADHTDTPGKYVYKISEIENSELKGYTFAKPIYAFVTVSDRGTGELDVQVTYKSDDLANDFTNATFINYYSVDGEIQFVGRKSLTGRKLEAGQFSFSLEVAKTDDAAGPKETDYKLVDTVKNNEDGIFAFSALKFAHKTNNNKNVYDVGTYYYRIKEVTGTEDPAGYTYSQEIYVIKVVVKDAKSGSDKLQVEATINGMPYSETVAENPIIFTNKYNASTSVTLKGTKTLSGSPLVKDQFTFEFLDQDQKTVLQTVKNAADGSFTFQPLIYDQTLTAATGSAEKIYYIRETVADAEKADGITYDSTLYKVTVTIKDKGDGTLETSSRIQTVSGTTEKDAEAIKFANTFAGSATITKTAEDGKTPLSGAEFELYAAKADGSGYTLYGKYTSDNNGKISVTGLPANSYYFVETKAPSGYFIPEDAKGNAVKYSFIIGVNAGAGKVANAVADFSQTIVNGRGYGTVELTKYDAAETNTLAGAQFVLYDSNGKQVAVHRNKDGNYTYSLTASENTEATLVTGKDGKITISGLTWGSYYFRETAAPEGYILSSDKISFTVDDTSFDAKGNPVTIKTKATNKATKVTIEKVDENGKALAGASMAIRDPQTRQIIETWTSTSKPHTIKGVLTAGKTYYLSELQAPDGYEIAAEQEFTVPADGKITVTMTDKKSDKKDGQITVTKKISLVDENANIVEVFAKDYTAYVGIFTDPAGEHPYGGNYLQTVQIHNASSGAVSFTGLPKGTYYVFETDANGTPITYDEMQTSTIGNFICTVEDGDSAITVKNKSSNSVTLNNVYYDFPDGFAYKGNINITKNVIKNGETTETDDTFYAGIFTIDEDGTYVLLNGEAHELQQNGTISVEVPLGGEKGSDPITYYVMETDETGTPIDKDVFAYEVSGEGTVSLDKDHLEDTVTIVNTVDEEEKVTPTPAPTSTPTPAPVSPTATPVPASDETNDTTGGQTYESDSRQVTGVRTGDNTPIGAYTAIFAFAALAIAGGVAHKKKKRKDNR